MDAEIVAYLQDHADAPVGVWEALNDITANTAPRSRMEGRKIKRQLLARLNPLVRLGVVRRIGRSYLTMVDEPHKAHHDFTGRVSGQVYANSLPITGTGGTRTSGGSDGLVIL